MILVEILLFFAAWIFAYLTNFCGMAEKEWKILSISPVFPVYLRIAKLFFAALTLLVLCAMIQTWRVG